uniref:Uncharacterized protein AlNc14C110G6352 n=1 Tax=Albugo laibachii Nc14 TaxID=890382 RepID=F0WIF2_9STRA|nr:conserved hypothetical protein [Albugo laibachii Nc14]|eukprot:CCA21034.1 conserved hypothetical protein [Albugo laibachii Nc14]
MDCSDVSIDHLLSLQDSILSINSSIQKQMQRTLSSKSSKSEIPSQSSRTSTKCVSSPPSRQSEGIDTVEVLSESPQPLLSAGTVLYNPQRVSRVHEENYPLLEDFAFDCFWKDENSFDELIDSSKPYFVVESTQLFSDACSISFSSLDSMWSIASPSASPSEDKIPSTHSDNQHTHDLKQTLHQKPSEPLIDSRRSNQDPEPIQLANRIRDQAIQELYNTEASYIRDLCMLHEYYILPLERHPIMQNPQIAVLFNHTLQLITLHRKLHSDLNEVIMSTSNSMSLEGIGAVFCRYVGLFTFHGAYAKDYEHAIHLFQSYRNDSKLGFSNFLKNCQMRMKSSEELESLLIKPIQRVPRYKLLLERIAKHTNAQHADHAYLQEAVHRVTQAAMQMNATVAAQANLEAIFATQQRFKGHISLIQPNRRLIKSGFLIKVSTRRKESVFLHLFNDLLLYSDPLITGDFRIRRIVELNSKAAGVITTVPGSHQALLYSKTKSLTPNCGFVVTSLTKSFLLFASNVAERLEWVECIQYAIREAQRQAQGGEEGPNDAAALWVPDRVAGACTVCHAPFRLYFRRHHCRRCGVVVCGNCSRKKSILFITKPNVSQTQEPLGGVARKERVCSRCFSVLDLVRRIAFQWYGKIVSFRGVLTRYRTQKWTSCYVEIAADVMKQYALTTLLITNGRQLVESFSLHGAITQESHYAELRRSHCFAVVPSKECVNSHLNRTDESRAEKEAWILSTSSIEDKRMWMQALEDAILKASQRPEPTILSSTTIHLSLEIGRFSQDNCVEVQRLRVVRRIIRSEECYVTFLNECSRLFIQPLLLRRMEGQNVLQQRQKSRGRFGSNFATNSVYLEHSSLSYDGYSRSRLRGLGAMFTSRSRHFTSLDLVKSSSKSLLTHSFFETDSVGLLDAELAVYFSSIDHICTLHQQLLERLSSHVNENEAVVPPMQSYCVGAILVAYAPLFDLYIAFACRHGAAMKTIESPSFTAFLRELPTEASLRRLGKYLSMPMHQLPQLKTLLLELLEITPSDHADAASLKLALQHVDSTAKRIESILCDRENQEKVLEFTAKLGISLGNRIYVKHGLLRKVCRRRVKQYTFLLLCDAIVFARDGVSLRRKPQLIELWECKVSDNPDGISSVAPMHPTAFYFFSPQKSFMVLAESVANKNEWIDAIRDCIAKTFEAHPSADQESAGMGDLMPPTLEFTPMSVADMLFVVKNGWLNVTALGCRKGRRLWITLTMQTFAFSNAFKATQPDESFDIGCCIALPLKDEKFFSVSVHLDATKQSIGKRTFILETQSLVDRDEWLRALMHCIGNVGTSSTCTRHHAMELRRRSVNVAVLAPIFMSNKLSSVCTICNHNFNVYRPRHHCRFCGCLACGHCSRQRWDLARSTATKRSRICDVCVQNLTASSVPVMEC